MVRMPDLNEHQQKYLADPDSEESKRWLADTSSAARGSGRTTAIAIRAFREAWQKPGISIPAQDHVPNLQQQRMLIALIKDLSNWYSCKEFMTFSVASISVNRPRDFELAQERVLTL